MEEKRGIGLFEITLSFITGALVGAGVAMFLTPVTGKEAREIASEKIDDLKEEIKKLEEKVKPLVEKVKTKENAEYEGEK